MHSFFVVFFRIRMELLKVTVIFVVVKSTTASLWLFSPLFEWINRSTNKAGGFMYETFWSD